MPATTTDQKVGAPLETTGRIEIEELADRLMRADPNTGEKFRIEWLPGIYLWVTNSDLRTALLQRRPDGFTVPGVTIRLLDSGNKEIAS